MRLLSCCMVLLGWIASIMNLLLQAPKQAHKQRLWLAEASWNMPSILKLCLLIPFQGFFVFSEPEGVKAKVSWELTYITRLKYSSLVARRMQGLTGASMEAGLRQRRRWRVRQQSGSTVQI